MLIVLLDERGERFTVHRSGSSVPIRFVNAVHQICILNASGLHNMQIRLTEVENIG